MGRFERVVGVSQAGMGCTPQKQMELRQREETNKNKQKQTQGGRRPWGSIRRPMSSEPAALITSLPQVLRKLANGWYNGTWNSLMSVRTCQWGNGSHVLFTDWMSQLLPNTLSSRPALFVFEIPAAAGTLSQNRQRPHGPEEHACKPREQPSDRPPNVVLFHGCDAPRFKYLAMGWNLLATDHA